MAIYVCGDTHHDIDYHKLSSRNWPESRGLTKEDYLIVLGDFGLVWYGLRNQKEESLIKWYNNKPWTTLFIDGNHENFDRLLSDEFSEVDMFGDKVKKIDESIFYLQRGRIYNIKGSSFFTFGGGISIDKNRRREYISWWKEELPSYAEIDLGVKNLEDHDSKVDYVLTHSAPRSLMARMAALLGWSSLVDERPLTSFLDWVEEHVEYKSWHFGHLHLDHQFDDKHFIHYNGKPMRLV